MTKLKSTTLEEFYKEAAGKQGKDINTLLPPDITREIGHFNIFDVAETIRKVKKTSVMPYNRRAYYKISLVKGKNRTEYADKIIDSDTNTLLFATPKVPYHWIPEGRVSGYFCIFNSEFMVKSKSGVSLDQLPIFQPGGFPVFHINAKEAKELTEIFLKMKKEISSDYAFKYDLLRNYLLELIHYGQKLQPATSLYQHNDASSRVTSLFIELLERQFPIESLHQQLRMRTAKDYADGLAIHVNHLNKVLKETTGKTTTDLISARILQEAKILLKQTDWTVSQIAFSLGFEEVAHFSNFFKKQASLTPLAFRA